MIVQTKFGLQTLKIFGQKGVNGLGPYKRISVSVIYDFNRGKLSAIPGVLH